MRCTVAAHALPRTLSDHCPVQLDLGIPCAFPRAFTWRFHSEALLDPLYKDTIKTAILQYFELNKGSVTSAGVLWEGFKATLRRICISTNVGILKDLRRTLGVLETEIAKLERDYEAAPIAALLATMREKTLEHEKLAEEEMRYISRRHRARAFGEGGRPGKHLVTKVKRRLEGNTLLHIQDASGQDHYSIPDIATLFRRYYENLYSTQGETDILALENYLFNTAIAWLSNGQREYLSQPITLEELRLAIQSLPNQKAPGPDSYTSEFYKTFSEELAPYLLEMYEEAYETGTLSPSLREAMIVMLLKPDKQATRCDSYRPLSLINIDTKILAKILATRLQPLMRFLVLPDQAGFIPGRSTSHNLRTLFAALHTLNQKVPAAAVMLDAAKAFDSLEWGYMFFVLKRMGLPPFFLNWIRLLYNRPTARVRIDGYISDPLAITRGTRQGCPLSPLLFSIALEPLACIIRQAHKEAALNFHHRPVIISLYADDMLLLVREPKTYLPPILREYTRFALHSGLHINWAKSTVMSLTDCTLPVDLEFPLVWATNSVKYLGIWINRDPQVVIRENYGSATNTLSDQIDRWIQLPDRIALIKMIVLPRYLYLFCNIPIYLPSIFLGHLERCC